MASSGNTKTLYHGELVKMGPVSVTVKSGVLKSRYAGKANYVELLINGVIRNYNCENPACEAFWNGQVGQTFTIVAEGSREQATINYVGRAADAPPPTQPPPRSNPPPPPQQQYTPPPQQHHQQPQAAPPPHAFTPPPQPAQPTRAQALDNAKRFVARNGTLAKVALRQAAELVQCWNANYGETIGPMPEGLVCSIYTSLLYGASNHGICDNLPMNVEFPTLVLPQPRTQQAPPPPQQAPPQQAPAVPTQPAEPEDNVPF